MDYLETLQRYQKFSQPQKILVGFLDAIEEQPLTTLQEIVTFLGGDVEKINEHCKVGDAENKSASLEIPDEIRAHLCSKYGGLLRKLSDRFGGYCTRWMNRHLGTNAKEENIRPTLLLEDCESGSDD